MIKIGVIGSGYWGPKLIRNFYELPNAKVTMVSDLSQERLNTIAQLYGSIATTQDYHQLLESDVEAVCIATPAGTHFKLVKEALLAGKHVLVEKPLTTSSMEARELCLLADQLGLVLMVGHTFEYNPGVEKMRELIQSGELGDIYYIDSARLNLGLFRHDANVLWDLAPHDFSIVTFLLNGAEPDNMTAHGAAHILPNIHDVVFAEAHYANNILANVHVSWLDPCKVRRTTVVGSKKMAVFNDVAEVEKIRIYDKKVSLPQESGSGSFSEFKLSYYDGDISILRVPPAEPLKLECKDFLNSIAQGSQPRANGWVGLKIVRMLEQADASLHDHVNQRSMMLESILKAAEIKTESNKVVLNSAKLQPIGFGAD